MPALASVIPSSARVVIALIALAMASVASGCADDTADIAANREILDALPVYAGAERTDVSDNPYFTDSGERVGYTTNVIYDPPDGTTDREVIDFYMETMPAEWDRRAQEIPIVEAGSGEQRGVILGAAFTRGEATVSVNTDNMMPDAPGTFEVAIDHNGAQP
jgi:hypothetical protein